LQTSCNGAHCRFVIAPAEAETTRLDAIVKGGILRVRLTEDYRPFSFAEASGKVEGIDVDMAMMRNRSPDNGIVLRPCLFKRQDADHALRRRTEIRNERLTCDDPAVASLFDGDNLDFPTIHLYGLTDPLSDEPVSKRGNIGDRPAPGIRLVLADDPECLATTVVAQDRDLGAERDHAGVSRVKLRDRARDAFREIARIPRSQLQSTPAFVGFRCCLSGFERLLAGGEGLFERTEAGLGHKVRMRGNRTRRQAHLACGLPTFGPEISLQDLIDRLSYDFLWGAEARSKKGKSA
jgi:hypothetical protein